MTLPQSVAVLIRLKAEQMRQAIAADDMASVRHYLKDIRKIIDNAEHKDRNG